MNFEDIDSRNLDRAAASVRALTLEAIERAQSGHPGLPLGCADLGVMLFSGLLQYDPQEPQWPNRDRFVLSGGHGSMLMYALLHISGYDVSIDDLKHFRSLGSKTPGHPEYGETPGIETTTGPLGQGLATAVGMALAQKHQMQQFSKEEGMFDNRVVVLAGDGDLMEGVVQEAVSFAGVQKLDNLILFYDSNEVTIDGRTDLTFSDDTAGRFSACGWEVLHCDGHDHRSIAEAYTKAHRMGGRPSVIIMRTKIGRGAPGFEGQPKAHAGAMGQDVIDHIRREAGIPAEAFSVPEDVYACFSEKQKSSAQRTRLWNDKYREVYERYLQQEIPAVDEQKVVELIEGVSVGDMIESRTTFSMLLDDVQQKHSCLLGGTADLRDPCLKGMTCFDVHTPEHREGNFLYYGIREHGMAAVSNGIKLYDPVYQVYCSTFLSFADYLRPALRLSALMGLPVMYILAYDSVYIGEDGPTHQPVEQLPSLRCMPNLKVYRPADAQEAVVCAQTALQQQDGPSACLSTRQKLCCFEKEQKDWQRSIIDRGAYIVKEASSELKGTIVATGSEVYSTLEAVSSIEEAAAYRIVSMPCRERFLEACAEERSALVPYDSHVIVVEAAEEQGWSALSSQKIDFIGIHEFGTSAPGDAAAAARGIDAEGIGKKISAIIV